MIALTIALAVFVGISLGLLGGGGSILTVPLLAYVAGMDAKPAIATSLLVVGVTSAVGAIAHARAGRVRWQIAAVFGAAAMAGAYGGGRLARFVPGTVLLIAFAVIMIAAAVAMLRGRKEVADASVGPLPVVKIVLQGASGATISHSPFTFLSVVVSPDAARISISSNVAESTVKTLSFFVSADPAGSRFISTK